MLVCGLYTEDYLQFFNVCPFDYKSFEVSGETERPLTGLITPVELLYLLQLIILRRYMYAIVVR